VCFSKNTSTRIDNDGVPVMHVRRICSDLVQIRSENPPGRTEEVIEYIRLFLEGLGIHSMVSGNDGGMCNLVTDRTGTGLLLCGHVDVVPALDAGWTCPPFSGIIDDRYVYGRGSTDMKGGCASVLAACEGIVNQDGMIPAMLAFVCDEETGGENGIRRLLAAGALVPCDCLIAEPTPARHPSIGQKGLCRVEMEFSGTPAHGSLYPAVGVSAIMEAMELLRYVKRLHDREYPVDEHFKEIIEKSSQVLGKEFKIQDVSEVLRKLTFNPGIIHGGEKSNVVAQHCTLELEIRVPWGCSIPALIAGITTHARNGKIISQETHNPSLTDPASPLVTITCDEVRKVWGGTVFPFVQWAASDARHLRLHGFNVLEYGPGEITSLHAVDERVPVDSLEKAMLVYRGVMERYAGIGGKSKNKKFAL
jgi:succinyl-diaminopimelate desuccinylase